MEGSCLQRRMEFNPWADIRFFLRAFASPKRVYCLLQMPSREEQVFLQIEISQIVFYYPVTRESL